MRNILKPGSITSSGDQILPKLSSSSVLFPQRAWLRRLQDVSPEQQEESEALSFHGVYTPLSVQRREIRVALLLPGRWSDGISCELSIVSLDENPVYEALSYVWGDPQDTVPIELNGHVFQATTNLRSALRRLRSASRTRTIWIDAICINQKDVKERTH